ncbi:EamA family transporter [Alcaligenes sp. SDU_A2]|uniref:EamA family transporter n=1 Tax=Alcaligenes sp. SDU_A2 TaxID=3136634 RepID=UPI002C016FBC|nr:EamA family transporter [Alcaligenes sp.]HRL26737.1 EamA family transporter [Alcaligenes sp.]
MSWTALSLVVVAAFIHAGWNLLSKRAAAAGAHFVFAYSIFAILFYFPVMVWVLVTQGNMPWNTATITCLVLSSLLHMAYSLSLQKGYQMADMSVVYPIARGTGPLLSSVGAFVLLGEPVRPLGVLGILMVVVGILLIATQGYLRRFLNPASLTGVRWGVQTGLLIAGYTVVDAYGVKVLLISPFLLDWFSNVLRVGMLSPYIARQGRAGFAKLWPHWKLAAGVGLLSPLSYILVLQALGMGAPLSMVAPAREMSMMVGAILGMVVLREQVNGWRLLGCAVLIGGVIFLTSGPAA